MTSGFFLSMTFFLLFQPGFLCPWSLLHHGAVLGLWALVTVLGLPWPMGVLGSQGLQCVTQWLIPILTCE